MERGFNQIYLYTRDYNEPFGYLIIYNTSEADRKFVMRNQIQSTFFAVHNNKIILMITVDIFSHKDPASKRGFPRTVEITEEDLTGVTEKQK